MTKPKIFIFANENDLEIAEEHRLVYACAIAEDGTGLAAHMCSHRGWIPHDMGITSNWKHEVYDKHYPNGYELILCEGQIEKGKYPELDDAFTKSKMFTNDENEEKTK